MLKLLLLFDKYPLLIKTRRLYFILRLNQQNCASSHRNGQDVAAEFSFPAGFEALLEDYKGEGEYCEGSVSCIPVEEKLKDSSFA